MPAVIELQVDQRIDKTIRAFGYVVLVTYVLALLVERVHLRFGCRLRGFGGLLRLGCGLGGLLRW